MGKIPAATTVLIGYDAGSGEKLFEHGPSMWTGELHELNSGSNYEANGTRYRVVRRRHTVTVTRIEIEVEEFEESNP